MASKGVSTLKFVGTVSLGLLTGLSYSLSTLTVPTLLTLPSASTASSAFQSLSTAAKTHIRVLASASGTALLAAFLLSPRAYRHPYLLYTSVLAIGSQLLTHDLVASYLFPASSKSSSAAARKSKKERSSGRPSRMDMSYEMLSSGSEAHSEGTASGSGEDAEAEEEQVNGEEVRSNVEGYLKRQMASTVVAGLGFLMAVVGIWGDGVVQVYSETIIMRA